MVWEGNYCYNRKDANPELLWGFEELYFEQLE